MSHIFPQYLRNHIDTLILCQALSLIAVTLWAQAAPGPTSGSHLCLRAVGEVALSVEEDMETTLWLGSINLSVTTPVLV